MMGPVMSLVMICFLQGIKTIGTANLSSLLNSDYRGNKDSLAHLYGRTEWPVSSPSVTPLIPLRISLNFTTGH